MRVLVLGSGAREHAVVHALRRSEGVSEVYAAPGNPGIARAADCLPVAADDLPSVAEAAADLKVDVTIVGPELPLALGIGDEFARRGLRLFGPRRDAAMLESSKVFAKDFCRRHGIPTADSRCARSADEAAAAARELGLPVVFKADGLASGKGVLMVRSEDELAQAIEVFFVQRRFGDAGDKVLVEECLSGEEVSYMAITDGTRVVPIATSHDYKRAHEGDQGPNTGGMGAHSPALVIPPGTSRLILNSVVRPAVAGMAAEGREYRGVLYAGLMMTAAGPRVLEFNCRLGDPETQAIFLRLDDNFAAVARDAADGALQTASMQWRKEAVACIVVAAEGYPGSPRRGDQITGVDDAMALAGVTVYHAGTKLREDGTLVTAGGRVLSVCGRGSTLDEALGTAYAGVERIDFTGKWYRPDIGRDTLESLGASAERA
ncbi:MAG: phosphoribosylamine--glycine ligase [Thermoanaerobaculales bacterium]|nr:phosphoribosylamine--glycine ligase [Thermoanaerobaculales bacterium]